MSHAAIPFDDFLGEFGIDYSQLTILGELEINERFFIESCTIDGGKHDGTCFMLLFDNQSKSLFGIMDAESDLCCTQHSTITLQGILDMVIPGYWNKNDLLGSIKLFCIVLFVFPEIRQIIAQLANDIFDHLLATNNPRNF